MAKRLTGKTVAHPNPLPMGEGVTPQSFEAEFQPSESVTHGSLFPRFGIDKLIPPNQILPSRNQSSSSWPWPLRLLKLT